MFYVIYNSIYNILYIITLLSVIFLLFIAISIHKYSYLCLIGCLKLCSLLIKDLTLKYSCLPHPCKFLEQLNFSRYEPYA